MTITQIQACPFFFSALLALGVIGLVWRYRNHPGGNTFILMNLAVAFWAAPSGMVLLTNNLTTNIFWVILSYPGVLSTPVLFFIFVVKFSGHEHWLSRRNLVLLWTIPVVTLVIVCTNNWHHLQWTSFTPDMLLGKDVYYYGHGPWFYVMLAYLYLLMLAASLLLIQAASSFQKTFRIQTLAVLFGIPLPWLGNLFYILGISPIPGTDTAPIFMSVTGLILALAIFRFQLLDLAPVAREIIIEYFQDGILVMDNKGRIVDFNQAAKNFLGLTPGRTCIGQPVTNLVPYLQELIDHPAMKMERYLDNNPPLWLEMHLDPLHNPSGRMLGNLLTVRNITDRKEMELVLRDKSREMERLAVSDGLTGLFNRRYIESVLALEFERCERYQQPLAIAMFDIDLFKGINDRFGHPCGDDVIRWVSRELVACLRSSDIAARVGGDEFLILFPHCTQEGAWKAIERLRGIMAETVIPCTGDGVTISGGVTAWHPGDNPNATLQRVDRLLYQAKERSRNLIIMDVLQEEHTSDN